MRRLLFLIPPSTRTSWFSPCCAAWLPWRCAGSCATVTRRIPVLASTVFVRFPAPLGLAAGFDTATALSSWGDGVRLRRDVAPSPLIRSPATRPRLFRLADDRALLNRDGVQSRCPGTGDPTARHRPEIPIKVISA